MGTKGKKTGGRKKGTPNKRTQEFIDVLERRKFSPADALVDIFRKASKQFHQYDKLVEGVLEAARNGDGIEPSQVRGLFDSDEKIQYLEIARKVATDLMQYRFPKRKAIEHTGAGGESLAKSFIDLMQDACRDEDGDSE